MSTRISHYEHGHGVKLEIDGFEVPELRDIVIRCPVGELVTVTADVYATKPFEIDLKTALVKFTNVAVADAARELVQLIEDTYGNQALRESKEFREIKARLAMDEVMR